jgi:hypothetical protein
MPRSLHSYHPRTTDAAAAILVHTTLDHFNIFLVEIRRYITFGNECDGTILLQQSDNWVFNPIELIYEYDSP